MTRSNVPTWWQIPNWFTDELASLLDGDEMKVLLHVARHTLGWQHRADTRRARLSLSHICEGYETRSGERIYGTGLNEKTAREKMAALVEFNLVLKLAENDPTKNEGPEYELPLEVADEQMDRLRKRQEEKRAGNKRRTAKAGQIIKAKRSAPAETTDIGDDEACEALPSHGMGSVDHPLPSHGTTPLPSHGRTVLPSHGTTPLPSHGIQQIQVTKKKKTKQQKESRAHTRTTPKLPPVYGDLFLAIKTGSRVNTQAAANAKRVSDAAKFLCSISEISAGRVQEFYAWFSKNDWRGRDKGEIPSPAMLVEEWGKFESGFVLPPRQAPPSANRPGRASDAEAEQFRNAMRAAAMGGPQ